MGDSRFSMVSITFEEKERELLRKVVKDYLDSCQQDHSTTADCAILERVRHKLGPI